ncbi:MAG: protein kinase [Planctomycetes bacterium]|nr:protein kinase [Planctomycetota bacterium]
MSSRGAALRPGGDERSVRAKTAARPHYLFPEASGTEVRVGGGESREQIPRFARNDKVAPKSKILHALSIRAKLDIAAQVADAFAAAAASGVIHQDVKPDNILVDESAPPFPSGAPRVKLADFGVGRVVNEEFVGKLTLTGIGRSIVLTTQSGSDTGTLLYMAPERLEGKPATPRSDLYSLGVVLFQMISRDLDRAVTLDWEADVADPTLRGDLRKALAGPPAKRFAGAAEFAGHMRVFSHRQCWRREWQSTLWGLLLLAILAFVILDPGSSASMTFMFSVVGIVLVGVLGITARDSFLQEKERALRARNLQVLREMNERAMTLIRGLSTPKTPPE